MALMDDLRRELERAAAEAQRQAAAARQQNAPGGGPAFDLGLNAQPAGAGSPAPRLAVVTCMDNRVPVEKALNLRPGEAHIIRNAGGLVTDDALRSLAVSHHQLGVPEIVVIGHTDCRMTSFRDDELRARIRRKMGPGARLPGAFGAFTSVEANVGAQMRRVRASGLFPPALVVRGYVYDLQTGRLNQVAAAAAMEPAGRVAGPPAPVGAPPTARVGGRLQRQGLQKVGAVAPAASPVSAGPTSDDFRRKVEAMEQGEAAPLNAAGPPSPAYDLAIPAGTAPVSGHAAPGSDGGVGAFALNARDLLRALVLGSVVAEPRAKRSSRAAEPRR